MNIQKKTFINILYKYVDFIYIKDTDGQVKLENQKIL